MSASYPGVNIGELREHEAPYPSWTFISGGIAAGRDAVSQDSQALKEAQIWRALAEEACADEAGGATGSNGKTAHGGPGASRQRRA